MRYSLSAFVLICLIAFTGCESSKTALRKGDYDLAIKKSVKKLRKDPTNQKEVLVLEEAYKKAQLSDLDKINFMKKEGDPNSWEKIFNAYSRIKDRQEMIKSLPPLKVGTRTVSFEYINCDDEIIQAKQKAAEYFYVHALSLIQKGGKQNARIAYSEFEKVKQYYSDYKDIDQQLSKVSQLGLSNVLFKMKNQTRVPLPREFEEDLTKISLHELNQKWTKYYTKETKGMDYDFTILVNMKMIDVSPESVKEIHNTESREFQDGWNYALDEKGNVKKDSLGNDIKTPKTRRVSCEVIENVKKKSARIAGTVDYVNNSTGQLMKSEPIAADAFFENSSATALGDISALRPETKNKIGKPPVPFPSDFDLLLQAGTTLKSMTKDIIWRNKNLLN